MDTFTQSALLKALGWALFDSLWQMALLWLFYILVVSVFPKMAAHRRHGLAILLILAGTIGTLLSFINYMASGGTTGSAWLNGIFAMTQHPGYGLPAALRQFTGRLIPYCSLFYLIALGFLFIRYSNHYLQSRRLRQEGLSRIGPDLRIFVAQTARRMGIKKEIGVWLSSMIEGPVTLGFLRPVILMPFAMVNSLSLEQVEAILLHELAHIKRYDYLLNLAVTVMQLLFFFNPFARLLIWQFKKEREHRCDDLVLQFKYDPHTYASALLSLAATTRHSQRLALAATGKNDYLLLQRVKRILKQGKDADRPRTGSVFILLFTVFAALMILPHWAGPVSQRINPAIPVRTARDGENKKAGENQTFVLNPVLPSPEKRPPGKRESKKYPNANIEVQDEPSGDLTVADNENNTPFDDPADQESAAVNISISHIDLPPVLSHTGQLLTAALTDEKSSASEVKDRIINAIAANESALVKTRQSLEAFRQAIGALPSSGSSADQSPGQESQRRLLEEKVQLNQQELLMQQDLKKMLEKAAKKLTIVYI